VIVEQMFGRLKRRFHVLHGEIRMTPERACVVIGACAVLHNIAMDFHEPMDGDEAPEADDQAAYRGPENGQSVRAHITQSFF
jgi:hypothetical protein